VNEPARDEALQRLIDRLEANFDQIVATVIATLFSRVELYRTTDVAELEREATENTSAAFRVLLTSLHEGRPLNGDDLLPIQRHAVRRVRQRIPLQAFLEALRVGQIALWAAVLNAAGDDRECQHAALLIVEPLLRLIEIGSAEGADAYLEAQAQQLVEIDRLRRDLLEDLLASADVSAGPKQALLRTAGLVSGRPYVVALARPVTPVAASQTLTDAAAVLGRGDMHAAGLTIARQDEIVAVLPVPAAGQSSVASRLELAVEELSRRGIDLVVGISMSHDVLTECSDAYAEASHAHMGLHGQRGVLALPTLGVLEYLLLCADETARRLIRPKFREFVADDEATSSELVDTVLEYIANDLNATASARRMHVHVNTFYYRLDSIGKRTGIDLHRLSDLQELLVAIKLLRTVRGPARP
jgi:PucR C-terminal helix-turn-helix domain/GGDEF-like domain